MTGRLLICCITILLYQFFALADTLVVAGHRQDLASPLIVQGSEVLAPLSSSLRLLGARVAQNGNTVTVTSHDGKTLTFTLDAKTADAGGRSLTLQAAPRVVNDVLYLPAKALATWLGAEARFDDSDDSLSIYPLLTTTYADRDGGLVILVRSAAPLQYTSSKQADPDRVLYDFKYASLGMQEQQIPVGEGILDRIRLSQFSASPAVVRLVADLNAPGDLAAEVSDEGRLLTINVGTRTAPMWPTPPSATFHLTGLLLSSLSPKQSEIMLQADVPVTAQSTFDAGTHQLTLRFANGVNNIPTEQLKVNDDPVVASITAADLTDTPGTQLVITLKQNAGYLVEQLPTGMRVLTGTFSMGDMVVVLDAGHGGYDTGAIGPGGTMEKDINLDVILRAGKLLRDAGCTVLFSRSNNTFIPLNDRPALANSRYADVFVSVHCNSSARVNSCSGTQVYYNTPQSTALAAAMHTEMINALGLKDGGIRQANFLVIRKSLMPSVLIELAFINNTREEDLLGSATFRQQAAQGVVNGLRRYAASNAWKWRRVDLPATAVASTPPITGLSIALTAGK